MANRKFKILYAEDDAPVRRFISLILQENDFDVIEAEDGEIAEKIYMEQSDNIDIIVSDLCMPNKNGDELAEFNYKNKYLPFVVCTAYGDAKRALSLLQYGVQDYVVKPINAEKFVAVIKNAIFRSLSKTFSIESGRRYDGNVATVKVGCREDDIFIVLDWVREKVANIFKKNELEKFLGFTLEFLLNAYEHGSLGINEEDKSRMITKGTFQPEKKSREVDNLKEITVSLSVLESQIALDISDEGDGFDYKKYLEMSEDELMERLELPNGRGIYMSKHYFNSIVYSYGGRNVQLIKTVN